MTTRCLLMALAVAALLDDPSADSRTVAAAQDRGASRHVCQSESAEEFCAHEPEPANALEGMQLLWPYSIYHARLAESSVTEAAAATESAVGAESLADAGVDLTMRGVQLLSEEARKFVVKTVEEKKNAHMACGYSPPVIHNVLLDHLTQSDSNGQESLYARSRFALRRLLEVHVERWVAGTWMHPLLEARAAYAAAVKISIDESAGYVLRANGRDAIWPCAAGSRRDGSGAATVILVLDDAGDPWCNSSSSGRRGTSTWWMSDPRGSSAYRLPPLFQMGADANVCGRASEVWVIPPGVPLTFPPHESLRSRVLLVAAARLKYVHDDALLAFLASEPTHGDSSERGAVQDARDGGLGEGVAEPAAGGGSEQGRGNSKDENRQAVGGRGPGAGAGAAAQSGMAPLLGTLIEGWSGSWRLWRGRRGSAAGGVAEEEAVRRSLAASMLVRRLWLARANPCRPFLPLPPSLPSTPAAAAGRRMKSPLARHAMPRVSSVCRPECRPQRFRPPVPVPCRHVCR